MCVAPFPLGTKGLSKTLDRAALTWTCPPCQVKPRSLETILCVQCQLSVPLYDAQGRPRKRFCSHACQRVWNHEHRQPLVRAVCAYCQILAARGLRAPEDVTFSITRWRDRRSGLKHHFCNRSHRTLYQHEQRIRTLRCQRCDAVIERKGNGAFCSWECYVADKYGRPNPPRHPSDAEQNVLALWASGFRGTSRAIAAEAQVSANTVLKLKKAGKLVEPAAGVIAVVA